MAKKVKITRKQIKQDDKFLAAIKDVTGKIVTKTIADEDSGEKFRKIAKYSSIILGVALVIGLAFYIIVHFQNKGAERLMAQADAIYRVPVVSEKDLSENEMLRKIGAYTDAKKKWSDAAEYYESVISKYSSTEYGILSRLYAANCYYEMGEYQEALKKYEDYIDAAGSDAPFSLLARQSIGYAQEALQQYDAAEQTFLGLTAVEGNTISMLSFFDLARVYEEKKEYSKAVDALKKIEADESLNNPQFYQLKKRATTKIAWLQAQIN